MHYNHKFAIISFIIGFFAIILGIIALTTPVWISINYDHSLHPITYDLFRQCKSNINQTSKTSKNKTITCIVINSFQIAQYLEIIGYISLVIGLFVGILCTVLINKRTIHFISPLILIVSTIMILLGLIFYIKYVIEVNHNASIIELRLGYSIILMIITCVIGFILTAYFSYTAGYIHRHIVGTVNIY
jgi:hypothetical protein